MWDKNLLQRAVEATLRQWPSFQLALSNGMGGPDAEAKVEWMCRSLVELFEMNEQSTQIDDVLDYLSDMINNEFDTIIEDTSTEMVCASIVAYFNRLYAGDNQFVLDKLEILKQKQELIDKQTQQSTSSATPEPKLAPKEAANSADIEMTSAEDAEQDDGWTVVKRKR